VDDEWVCERGGKGVGAGWDRDVGCGERDGGEVSGEGGELVRAGEERRGAKGTALSGGEWFLWGFRV
jgi:hypothetical protein